MTVATWNVNSIRVRLPHVLDWLKRTEPDVLCLQETKIPDADFPCEAFEQLGYIASVYGQKTYNGVAILSFESQTDVQRGLPDDVPDDQRRFLMATIRGVRVASVYVPNGEAVSSPKFAYKLAFLERLSNALKGYLASSEPLLLCGDYNIAPADIDLHDPEGNRETVMFHTQEHAFLRRWEDWGLRDSVRQQHPDTLGLYSWWDYRTGGFARNRGWRIDHIWATEALAKACTSASIDRAERGKERPSDHAPVIATFRLSA
ncbi:exodeoxyribonuclease III [Chloracidobacterium validum]|uniref:Exodeoxyribonuclease III n=1 Tax=Chloracidobacterium validum TaxID=2821543 RepID=A0ABX8BB81_9BACT|nr:exodeoxyribonuclease III [Chloracidobacterium validum]